MCEAFSLGLNSPSQAGTVVVPILLMKTPRLGEGKTLVKVVQFVSGGSGCEPQQANAKAPSVDPCARCLPPSVFHHGSQIFASCWPFPGLTVKHSWAHSQLPLLTGGPCLPPCISVFHLL